MLIVENIVILKKKICYDELGTLVGLHSWVANSTNFSIKIIPIPWMSIQEISFVNFQWMNGWWGQVGGVNT
jgi:hypothetical protein